MKGVLAQRCPADILSEVLRRQMSGILSLRRGTVNRQLFLDAGSIIRFAASTAADESLVAWLLEKGGVTEAQIREATGRKEPHELLGTVLVRLGSLDSAMLVELTEGHVRRVLGGALRMTDGEWEFQQGALPFRDQLDAGVRSAEALLEWTRSLSDADWIRRRLGPIDARVHRDRRPPEGYQSIRLSPVEGFIMSRVDGAATIREIIMVSPTDEEKTLAALLGLSLSGILEPPPGSEPAFPPPDPADRRVPTGPPAGPYSAAARPVVTILPGAAAGAASTATPSGAPAVAAAAVASPAVATPAQPPAMPPPMAASPTSAAEPLPRPAVPPAGQATTSPVATAPAAAPRPEPATATAASPGSPPATSATGAAGATAAPGARPGGSPAPPAKGVPGARPKAKGLRPGAPRPAGAPKPRPVPPPAAKRPPEPAVPAQPVNLEQEMLTRHAELTNQDLYHALGVASTASTDEIRRAYYSLARRFHPDKFRDDAIKEKAEQVFARITEAYATLSDHDTRAYYDGELASHRGGHEQTASDTTDLARQNFRRGRDELDRGRFAEALTFLMHACEQDPNKGEYFEYLGAAQARNPRLKKQAEESLLKAIALSPTSATAYVHLAGLYERAGAADKAKDLYRKALAWDPDNPAAKRALEGDQQPAKRGILGIFGRR